MCDYAAMRGVPAVPGRTTLDLDGDEATATTYDGDDRPIIRSVARVGSGLAETARGHLRYITAVDGRLMSGKLRLRGRDCGRLRAALARVPGPGPLVPMCCAPKTPLEVTFGFYGPRVSFCYPGGDGPL